MTPVQVLRRALAVNSAASSFASRIPAIIKPFVDGVIAVPNGEDTLDLFPFGAGSDDNTFDLRVIGWRRAVYSTVDMRNPGAKNAFIDNTNMNVLWVPSIVAEVTCTLSAIVGIAGAVAINTDRFADIITVNKGIGVVNTVLSDAGAASLTVDVSGFELLEITTNTTSSATNGNALFALYGGANG